MFPLVFLPASYFKFYVVLLALVDVMRITYFCIWMADGVFQDSYLFNALRSNMLGTLFLNSESF